jgi:hypothetical protein
MWLLQRARPTLPGQAFVTAVIETHELAEAAQRHASVS